MTPDTAPAWKLMTPTEHAFAYALFALLGIIFLFCLYKIIFCPTEHDKEELKEHMKKRELKKRYKRSYNYWYNKSYGVIDGCAAQAAGKRDAYARHHASKDIFGD